MRIPGDEISSWRPDDLAETVWEALVLRLWHATSIQGLRAILNDGCIRVVEENMGARYRVASLMFARGCVILFDFGPTAGPAWLLQAQYRNWGGWLSGHYDDRALFWLELDRELTADRVIPAGEVRRIAKANPTEQGIPGVEAGHFGPVPLTSLRGALIFCAGQEFEHHRTVDAKRLARAEELGNLHWRPNPYIERLRNRRRPAD